MKKNQKDGLLKNHNIKWVVIISLWTFFMAFVLSLVTENLTTNLSIIPSFFILIIIIFIGIIFDIVGIAVTKSDEKPFHSMASKKINEAKIAIKLIRNADKVSNFCNDVIGDISGIISGAVGANLIHKLSKIYKIHNLLIFATLITSLTAALTVGGKAFGKSIALNNHEKIMFSIAKTLNFIENSLKIFFEKKTNNNRN